MTALLVILMVIVLVSIDAVRLYLKRQSSVAREDRPVVVAFAQANPPRGLFVDKSHTWVRVADSGEMRIGIDELMIQALGGADAIELPDLGKKIHKGDSLATLRWRDGRSLAIPSPVDGAVVTSSNALELSPGELAADPYGSGWLTALWPVDHASALKPLVVGEASSGGWIGKSRGSPTSSPPGRHRFPGSPWPPTGPTLPSARPGSSAKPLGATSSASSRPS